jgi:hypothetical protein
MPEVIGIGGAFLFSENTQPLADWYNHNLGFKLIPIGNDEPSGTYYQEFACRDFDNPQQKRLSVFAVMPTQETLRAPRNQAMINFRVNDLEVIIKKLNAAGIATDPVITGPDGEGTGKFTRLQDVEGNLIELWEHNEP